MTLDDLLTVPYIADGREPTGADCYGLTRLARGHLFGKPWMPLHGAVEGHNKRALTGAVLQEAVRYQPCRPRPGAIATAWRGRLCTHIAIVVSVDGRPMILETNEPGETCQGARLTSIQSFKDRFLRVVFYDD